ncbi:MAG: hypothetical protein OXK73_03310 [Rhodospirillaceae bacterium]|nr:hypothetical protein [Rhodospirillaceae bacterium]
MKLHPAAVFGTAAIAALVVAAASGVIPPPSPAEIRERDPLRAGLADARDLPWPSGEGPDASFPDPSQDPTYGMAWLMVIDAPEFTVAVVTNIFNLWWVRVGDTLPDGLTVTWIETHPPGVTVAAADGSRHTLSYWCGDADTRPAPGAGGET